MAPRRSRCAGGGTDRRTFPPRTSGRYTAPSPGRTRATPGLGAATTRTGVTGLPIRSPDFIDAGYDRQPDFTIGITNTLRYKRFTLNFLVDILYTYVDPRVAYK